MQLKILLKSVGTNKILMYMLTRYITYGLSFFVTMYIATKMEPYYYGVWGYLLLVLNYLNLITFGIPQATHVLFIQNKGYQTASANYEKSGLFLTSCLSFGCAFVALYYYLGGFSTAYKYSVGWLFYLICICGALNYVNLFYSKIYRSRNYIFEVAFQQTSVVVLMFIAMFLSREKNLLYWLAGCYLVAYLASSLLFLLGRGADFSGSVEKKCIKKILNKGIFLFMYNSGFYFIIVSTKTMVSMMSTVEQFGYFSFAYLLGNAVFLMLQAFSFLVFSKLIDRYRSADVFLVLSTIRLVRVNFVFLFHGVMYVAMLLFPLLLTFIPKYANTLKLIYLCCLMMLLYTNSFGYSTFLMARNKEKRLAYIAVNSLILNVALGVLLINVFKVSYEYVVFCTIIAYFYYAFSCVYYGRKELNLPNNFFLVVQDCFPIPLIIPFGIAILLTLFECYVLIPIPLLSFLLLNRTIIKEIIVTGKKILLHPNLIDI
jgi:O-antigen/teichoic acid export membrane protein